MRPGGPKPFTEFGNHWTVKTTSGKTVDLFEADPRNQQPPATQAIPDYQDPSYNCHGYSLGATGAVGPDGISRSFQIIDHNSVTNILTDGYDKITVAQAIAEVQSSPNRKNLIIAFKDKNSGEIVHSAVNASPQDFYVYGTAQAPEGLGPSTVVSFKNGSHNFQQNTSVNELMKIYDNCDILIYRQK